MIIPSWAKILIIAVALGFSFWVGYDYGTKKSEVILADFKANAEKKIADLQKANSEAAIKEVIKYRDRVETVEKIKYVYRDVIKNVPSKGNLSNGWVYTHDQLAKGNPNPDESRVQDPTESNTSDVAALEVVGQNYNSCDIDRARLASLQNLIREYQEQVKKENEK